MATWILVRLTFKYSCRLECDPSMVKITHFCRNISCEIMIKLIIMPWINDQWYILKYLSQSQWLNITLLRVYSLSLSLARTRMLSLSLLHTLKQTKNLICNPLIQFKKSYFKLIKQTKQLQLVTVHQTQLTVKFKEGHARYPFIIMQLQCSPWLTLDDGEQWCHCW